MGRAALVAGYQRRFGALPRMASGGAIPLTITFPSSQLTTRVHVALGADLTASYLTWNWLDVTEWVRHDLGITVDFGRRNESTGVSPSKCQLKLTNDDGRFSRRNPHSPYFGLLGGKVANTPIWIELDAGNGFVDRYFGYVNEWPVRWTDPSGEDSYVVIQCAGAMRWRGQDEDLKSAMFRSISGVADGDFRPHVHIPMEEGPGATSIASGLAAGAPATYTGDVTFASDSPAGSLPLPLLAAGASVFVSVPTYTDERLWLAQFAMMIPERPSVTTTYAEMRETGGTVWKVEIEISGADTTFYLKAYTGGGTLLAGIGSPLLPTGGPANPPTGTFFGRWLLISVGGYENAGVDTGFFGFTSGSDGVVYAGSGTSLAIAHNPLTSVTLRGGEGAYFGQLGVYVDGSITFDNSDGINNVGRAIDGWSGEMAHDRMARLCREEDVPFVCQAATSAAMGPQTAGGLLDALRTAETADLGVLYEYRFGLAYQALSERFNAPVAFELDFDQWHIYQVPETADDDQRFRNQWRISRPDGSSATARDPDYDNVDGLHPDSDNVELEDDDQLYQHAGWRVRRDSVDEDRWPRMPINLGGTPELIPGWTSTPFGARVTVANPPAQVAPDAIDGILEGYTERWDTTSWIANLNLSPASVYQVGIAGDSTSPGSWAQTADAVIAEDVDTTETLIDVTSTDTWTTSPGGEWIVLGGEVMSLDAVSGSAPNWTFTVTRSVNGVVKSHFTTSPAKLRAVRIYRPAVAVY